MERSTRRNIIEVIEPNTEGGNMKPSEILREVARRVERNEGEAWNGLCGIVDAVAFSTDKGYDGPISIQTKKYLRAFGTHRDVSGYWFGDPGDGVRAPIRILAACFAAAVAESEGY
jgi:hypothetical protein